MHRRIHNRVSLIPFRKKLRNDCTLAEAELWSRLKDKRLSGRKFRRQHSIENYIVDFYCPSEKIVMNWMVQDIFIASGQEADKRRDDRLKELGFKVLRFENIKVWEQLDSVLEEIRCHFTSPPPPLQGGDV